MNKLVLLFLIIIVPLHIYSQNISGIIYDEDEALVAVKVINLSQNIIVLSNTNGTFLISAKRNDTLQFQSTFHKNKTMVVEEKHLVEDLVIELKKSQESLSEVFLENEAKVQFNQEKYGSQLSEQIANDIKNNPENYSGAASGNMDFVAIFGMIAKLFKGKNSKNNEPEKYVNATQIKELFENDKFFNQNFLIKDLHINIAYHELFFDFIETKSIPIRLLAEEEQINLIALFIDYGKEFNAIISESKRQKN